MIRRLAYIAAFGLLGCVLCLGIARSMGTISWHSIPMHWTINTSDDKDDPTADSGPEVSRSIAWQAGSTLVLNLPAHVTYTQGPDTAVVVRGRQGAVEHVEMVGNELKFDRSMDLSHHLEVAITAPAVTSFKIESAESFSIRNYHAASLTLAVDGAGDITADGDADSVAVTIDGAGNANLGALAVHDAKVSIDGFGNVTVGPDRLADIDIDGAGNVSLTKHPASLTQRIDGAGHISQP